MGVIINPEYIHLTGFINNLPVSFPAQGETIYDGRNTIKVIETGGEKVVVKSYKIPHFINKIAYTFFRQSKAKRAYEYGFEILSRGCDTPSPIAYIEKFRCGLLHASYSVSAYSPGISMKKEFCFIFPDSEERMEILRQYAAFTARLHDVGIYHPDYSNGNIMYQKAEGDCYLFELVDLNRIRFGKVTEEMSYKTFHRMDLSLSMLETVAREYATHRGLDVEKSIAKITAYNLKTMEPYKSFNLG